MSGVDRLYRDLLHVLHFNVFLPIDSRDLRVSNIYLVEEPLLQEDILIVGDFAVASVMCDTRTCTRRSNSMYNLMLNHDGEGSMQILDIAIWILFVVYINVNFITCLSIFLTLFILIGESEGSHFLHSFCR